MSARSGTFSRISISGVSRLAAISGNAAFLAPPIGITPASGTPPLMQILSITSFHRPPAGAGRRPSAGARLAVEDAFTGTGGSRSSRRLALPVRSSRLLNRPPILRALLFLATHQVLAQRFGEPCFAGSPLDTLPRGDPGRLSHPAMQQERCDAVKESTCCSMRNSRAAADDHGNLAARQPSSVDRPARWTRQPDRNNPEIRVQRGSWTPRKRARERINTTNRDYAPETAGPSSIIAIRSTG